MVKWLSALAVIVAVMASGAVRAGDEVVLATINWPPYVGPDLDHSGFDAEIVDRAFEFSGRTVRLEYVTWARGLRLVAEGSLHGIFPAYSSPQREATYIMSAPYSKSVLGFFKRKDRLIRYLSLVDLAPYTIGVVRGYVNTPEIDDSDILRREESASDLSLLKKLFRGRLDLAVMDKYVGRHLIASRLPQAVGRLEFLAPPLEVKDLHIAFTRKMPGIQRIVQDFNRGVARLRESGAISEIMARHGVR
ncbi:MAG: substrate-binding periplasmic protein [Desulfovibrionaceae bacterium]